MCCTVFVCSQDGFTALHLAALEGNVDVVRLLTKAKAHVSTQIKVQVYTFWSTDLDSNFLSKIIIDCV